MRAVIRRDKVRIEFSGRGQMWNELLRPYLGGPEAPPEPIAPVAASVTPVTAPAPAAAPRPFVPAQYPQARQPVAMPAPVAASAGAARPAPSQPRTWYPPRPQSVQCFEPVRAPAQHYSAEEEDGIDVPQVDPSSDPATLYARLAAIPGRRSERDAVLAAVWFLTRGETETTADDVEAHFQTLRVFPDVKVVPIILKHIHRTKTIEIGSSGPKAVRLSKKGMTSVRGRLVPE
jgi:hypothetical protein